MFKETYKSEEIYNAYREYFSEEELEEADREMLEQERLLELLPDDPLNHWDPMDDYNEELDHAPETFFNNFNVELDLPEMNYNISDENRELLEEMDRKLRGI